MTCDGRSMAKLKVVDNRQLTGDMIEYPLDFSMQLSDSEET